jgi:hyperosmotically inducible protein
MKKTAKLLLLCSSLLSILMLVGCNKPQDVTASAKEDSKVSAELKDGEVTGKVKTALLLDEAIKSFDITVVTTKGDVRLTGVVDTQAQLEKIDKIVLGTEGVHSIHDELTLKK